MNIFIALLIIVQFAVVEARGSYRPKKWGESKFAPADHEFRLTRFEQARLKNVQQKQAKIGRNVQQERAQILRNRFIKNHFNRV